MKKDTFTLRKTFFKPISKLNDEQRGRLFNAIYQYQCGETPEPAADISVYFDFFVAEFEEEEERRRIRSEKAAERRRKKAEEKKAIKAHGKPDHKSRMTSRTVEKPSDQRKRKFLAFKKNMQDNFANVYRAGGRKLSFSEYEILNEHISEEKLMEIVENLNLKPENINKDMSFSHNIYMLNRATV